MWPFGVSSWNSIRPAGRSPPASVAATAGAERLAPAVLPSARGASAIVSIGVERESNSRGSSDSRESFFKGAFMCGYPRLRDQWQVEAPMGTGRQC
jgi:hypothetical protein